MSRWLSGASTLDRKAVKLPLEVPGKIIRNLEEDSEPENVQDENEDSSTEQAKEDVNPPDLEQIK